MPGELARVEARTRALPSEDRLPASGDYWRCTRGGGETDPAEGRVYLVSQVHVIDGEIHSLEIGQHPEERHSWRMMLEEFVDRFEYAPDGQDVRDREIAAVAARIDALQKRISAPPPDIRNLLSGPGMSTDASMVTDLVAAGTSVATLQEQAETAGRMLTAHAETIRSIAKSIGEETETLARYHGERAKAAIAQVSETIAHAEHLQRGVKTLGLYAGEGVVVTTLVEGEQERGDGPLSIYQRRLYLDEELLCRLDDGGADFSDDDTLADMMRRDPALMDRIIPGPRSVVLMRYRRNPKEREASGGDLANAFGAAMRAVAENEASERPFLLVRNGGAVHQVFADEALKPIERLFPRAADVDEIYTERGWRFSGIESKTITVRDLEYVDRRGKFEKMALSFRRVLTLLWGLDNRLQLFGEFYDRSRHQTMLSMEFQEGHMRFVADEEDVLEERRPTFRELQKAQNALIQPGSRLVVQWRKAMDSRSCPGAVRERRDFQGHWADSFVYAPVERVGIAVVRMSKGRLVVKAPCRHTGHGGDVRQFEINLEEAPAASHFCIDGMTSGDLSWYIQSRRERQNYLSYVRILQQAIGVLREEEGVERAALLDMSERTGCHQGGPHLRDAVRMWRASQGGATLPVGDEKALETAKRRILSMVETMTHGAARGDAVERIDAAMAEAGRRPHRIVARADGTFIADALHSDGERLRHVPDAWFVRTGADRKGNLHRREEHRAQASEPVVGIVLRDERVELPELPWRDAAWNEAAEIDRALSDATASPLYAMLSGTADMAECMRRAQEAASYDRTQLAWTRSLIPLALARESHEVSTGRRQTGRMRLIGISASPFDLISVASEDGRRRIDDYVIRKYNRPSTMLAHVATMKRPQVIRPTTGYVQSFLDQGRYAGAYGRHWECVPPTADAFDSRERFLSALSEGRDARRYEIVSWAAHADQALALARTYSSINDGE